AHQVHLSVAAQETPCREAARFLLASLTNWSYIGLLARWCSICLASSVPPEAARNSSRAVPSHSSHTSHSGPNCFSASWRNRRASGGLFPLVGTAICRSPRCITEP